MQGSHFLPNEGLDAGALISWWRFALKSERRVSGPEAGLPPSTPRAHDSGSIFAGASKLSQTQP